MKNLKRNIAIVCGGDSSEHDVSLRSAQGLYSFYAVSNQKYFAHSFLFLNCFDDAKISIIR